MSDFGTFLVEHLPSLRRYARALVGEREAADDLVQDCLERAWSRADYLRSTEEMRVWLFAILHNVHVSARRRAAARRRVPRPGAVGGTASPFAAPEEAVVAGDIERALARLDDDQRAAVLLVGLEDLSYREAAAILEIPEGTLMSRLHRGRRRLRDLLDGDLGAHTRLTRVK